LNLHRARVRRDRGRLPSSRCIESAPEHHAFILILLLMRASDTSLGLMGSYPTYGPAVRDSSKVRRYVVTRRSEGYRNCCQKLQTPQSKNSNETIDPFGVFIV
jgi:hypothetical protein